MPEEIIEIIIFCILRFFKLFNNFTEERKNPVIANIIILKILPTDLFKSSLQLRKINSAKPKYSTRYDITNSNIKICKQNFLKNSVIIENISIINNRLN